MASYIDFLKKGSDYIYPKTLVTAVYDLDGNTLDTLLAGKLGATATAVAADKLANARSINGTAFDGTGDITTSKWGTARDITIGSTKKSVDGSAAVTWTLTEIGAAAASHAHVAADITDNIPAAKISGVLSIENIPQGALERLVPVANEAAMLALTADDIQVGDTVKLADTGVMYYVKDASKLGTMDAFEPYTAGAATSVPWTGVTGKPSVFTPDTHTHVVDDIIGFEEAIRNYDYVNHSELGTLEQSLSGTIDSVRDSASAANSLANQALEKAGNNEASIAGLQSDMESVKNGEMKASGLKTAVSINGTSFDGTADITTDTWGAARNITIGDATKSVNGSAAVTYTLAEIGCIAAAGLAVVVDDSNIPKTVA